MRFSTIDNFEMYFQALAKMAQKMLMRHIVLASFIYARSLVVPNVFTFVFESWPMFLWQRPVGNTAKFILHIIQNEQYIHLSPVSSSRSVLMFMQAAERE